MSCLERHRSSPCPSTSDLPRNKSRACNHHDHGRCCDQCHGNVQPRRTCRDMGLNGSRVKHTLDRADHVHQGRLGKTDVQLEMVGSPYNKDPQEGTPFSETPATTRSTLRMHCKPMTWRESPTSTGKTRCLRDHHTERSQTARKTSSVESIEDLFRTRWLQTPAELMTLTGNPPSHSVPAHHGLSRSHNV